MWKKIPNWEEYEVNEFGDVKNTLTGNVIVGDINSAGYKRVCLYKNKHCKKFFRHRLVAELFIPNNKNYTEVNHKDGDKSNNYIANLEWCSRTHNEREAHRKCIKKYKPFFVEFVDGSKRHYEFAIELAKEIDVTKRTVQNYLQGKSKGYFDKGIISIQYL